jgi:ribosomal protein S18 acetylase RimI-like enzyme
MTNKKSLLLMIRIDGWTTEGDFVKGSRCTEEVMKNFIEESGKPHTLLFAFDGDSVVGTVQIEHSETNPTSGEIRLLSVSPAHQSRGIGGILLQAVLAEMKDLGYTSAVMHIFENRPTLLAWYKRMGFEETGARKPYYYPERLRDPTVQFINLTKAI